MPNWRGPVVQRVRQAVVDGRVRLTHKALVEVALLGLDRMDVLEILLGLVESDASSRFRSERGTGWMYVFHPVVGGETLYVKLKLKHGCVVISFHEDEEDQAAT